MSIPITDFGAYASYYHLSFSILNVSHLILEPKKREKHTRCWMVWNNYIHLHRISNQEMLLRLNR